MLYMIVHGGLAYLAPHNIIMKDMGVCQMLKPVRGKNEGESRQRSIIWSHSQLISCIQVYSYFFRLLSNLILPINEKEMEYSSTIV